MTSQVSPRVSPIAAEKPFHPVSLTDLFKVGIGPSSSHTIGPMRAAALFMQQLGPLLPQVERVTAEAFGSLAWTGKGHATDKALILGVAGYFPDSIDPDLSERALARVREDRQIDLPDGRILRFDPQQDLIFDFETTFERHPNSMRFSAYDGAGTLLKQELWFSIGGGFVVSEHEDEAGASGGGALTLPYPFRTGIELLHMGQEAGLSVMQMALANEQIMHGEEAILTAIDRVGQVMLSCIDRGLKASGELPGGLKVKRRARMMYETLLSERDKNLVLPHQPMDFVSVFAIAVNEENASGGQVVTAPTNGAAGVIPAVLRYYRDFCPGAGPAGQRDFLLAASAIGSIIKQNASISGAEVGCQGEVGSAAAMAAAGLAAALGGSNSQIEHAAEIAMEHHLGMTCDPIGGLVQIPCIERNAFGAVKAINAASLALRGDGQHRVTLDEVVETMRQTGLDMQTKYKETSTGGLAVNVADC